MQVKELSFLLELQAGREESSIRAEFTLVLPSGQGKTVARHGGSGRSKSASQ